MLDPSFHKSSEDSSDVEKFLFLLKGLGLFLLKWRNFLAISALSFFILGAALPFLKNHFESEFHLEMDQDKAFLEKIGDIQAGVIALFSQSQFAEMFATDFINQLNSQSEHGSKTKAVFYNHFFKNNASLHDLPIDRKDDLIRSQLAYYLSHEMLEFLTGYSPMKKNKPDGEFVFLIVPLETKKWSVQLHFVKKDIANLIMEAAAISLHNVFNAYNVHKSEAMQKILEARAKKTENKFAALNQDFLKARVNIEKQRNYLSIETLHLIHEISGFQRHYKINDSQETTTSMPITTENYLKEGVVPELVFENYKDHDDEQNSRVLLKKLATLKNALTGNNSNYLRLLNEFDKLSEKKLELKARASLLRTKYSATNQALIKAVKTSAITLDETFFALPGVQKAEGRAVVYSAVKYEDPAYGYLSSALLLALSGFFLMAVSLACLEIFFFMRLNVQRLAIK